MAETSLRLLRLLSLLQSRRTWSAAGLADRLEVTTRTIRKDVDRLRRLGYPVDARPGVAGGYRLGNGAALPPLFLDDDEAIAVAIGLGTAAGGSVAGIGEASLRALAKLQQVLPARLRRKINTMGTYALRRRLHRRRQPGAGRGAEPPGRPLPARCRYLTAFVAEICTVVSGLRSASRGDARPVSQAWCLSCGDGRLPSQ